ncbi:HAMP domain-containing histidine kinase [Clostridium sp. 19966]|uniref:HAMP domain-containing sensor histidine kinase n=1 Tax=Clostridium sp. 19966 TaxID=2768166 RepID=UPI0028DD9C70|nr:HAMP domain-containing sensor histidine kinase [Clostridium sp. 19966]MDT8717340.1 HAMP domain-containing histidine kinase [Clostridium sp. 19966]
MQKQNNKKETRKFRMSLRVYFLMIFILILCTACVFSFILVFAGMKLLYSGPITMPVLLSMCLLICCLTMLLGGFMMWCGSIHLTRPIEEMSRAVKKVAQGDFSVQIKRNEKMRGKHEFSNEIDELAVHFNKMAAELNGMDYMKKDFISNVAHEVQTPLAAVTGFTEILLEGGFSKEEQQEYLLLVNKESLRLSRLCDNMLSMSRLDNQQIVSKKDRIRVDEQLRKCIIMLSEKWPEKIRNYELDCSNLSIQSDASLLMQIWVNLIDNAIKYSSEDSTIWINGKIEEGFLVVAIRDEGDGITLEKQSKIFEKFYQGDESHKKIGNGLGLSIVKRIVDLLGGSITCISDGKNGTVMEVRLPV